MRCRIVPAAALTLSASIAATPAVTAAPTVNGQPSAAELIEKLGLHVAEQRCAIAPAGDRRASC